jgi:hypothetical protein
MTDEQMETWRKAQANAQANAQTRYEPSSWERREQQIRNETIEGVMAYLMKSANSPERIGKRALLLNWYLQLEKKVNTESQRELAIKLGVSEARVSQALAVVEDNLATIRGDGK